MIIKRVPQQAAYRDFILEKDVPRGLHWLSLELFKVANTAPTFSIEKASAVPTTLEFIKGKLVLFERLIIRLIQSLEACRLQNSPRHIPASLVKLRLAIVTHSNVTRDR